MNYLGLHDVKYFTATAQSREATNCVAAVPCSPPPPHEAKGKRRTRERDSQIEYIKFY